VCGGREGGIGREWTWNDGCRVGRQEVLRHVLENGNVQKRENAWPKGGLEDGQNVPLIDPPFFSSPPPPTLPTPAFPFAFGCVFWHVSGKMVGVVLAAQAIAPAHRLIPAPSMPVCALACLLKTACPAAHGGLFPHVHIHAVQYCAIGKRRLACRRLLPGGVIGILWRGGCSDLT